eukprot:2991652-Prymnesium_polylepis.1
MAQPLRGFKSLPKTHFWTPTRVKALRVGAGIYELRKLVSGCYCNKRIVLAVSARVAPLCAPGSALKPYATFANPEV